MMRNYVLSNQTVFDVLKREVVSPTQTIMLGGREAAILKLLCMHSNEVISKEQIHQQVWGKVLVSETSLTKAISNLRKSLVRIESLSCEIKTIPKEGYMLICEGSSILELSTEMVPTFNVKQINNVNASIELTRRISSQDSNNIESVSHITHTLISIRRCFMLLLASSLLASFISGAVFFLIK